MDSKAIGIESIICFGYNVNRTSVIFKQNKTQQKHSHVNVASHFLSSKLETKFKFEIDFPIVLYKNITLEVDNLER